MASAKIISPALGDSRIDRLTQFLKRLGISLDPSPAVLAGLVENLAQSFFKGRVSTHLWQAFYSELEKLFSASPNVLMGRNVLLCSDFILRAATLQPPDLQIEDETVDTSATVKSSRARSQVIFLPPKTTSTSDPEVIASLTNVPKGLSGGIAFLEESLQWHTDKMQGARAFLEKAKLVRNYDADEVIAHISQRMQVGSKKIRRQGLLWIFNLYRSWKRSSRPLSLIRARLFVPNMTGDWIQARTALFSSGWPQHTLGPITGSFLQQTASTSEDLHKLSLRLLASPKAYPFREHEIDDWVDFLTLIGVQFGLSPVPGINRQVKVHRTDFKAQVLGTRLGFPEATITLWEQEISKTGREPYYRSTTHAIEGNIWYFPGQGHHDQWPEQVRISYAELILHWLKKGQTQYFKTSFFDSYYPVAGRFEWPTPLAAFLRRAAWFPIKMPRHVGDNVFFQPLQKVWLQSDDDNERLPAYLPSAQTQIRKMLRQAPELVDRLRDLCNARVWNASNTLTAQADYLGELYKTIGIEPFHLRSFLNTYSKTWEGVANSTSSLDWHLDGSQHFIITEQNGKYHAINIKQHATSQPKELSEIYVKDVDDDLSVNLVKMLDAHVFSVDSAKVTRIASLLKPILGSRYRSIADLKIEVVVDGRPFSESKTKADKFIEVCPSLPKIVLLTTECLTSLEAQRLPAERTELIRSLNKIELCLASEMAFMVRDELIGLPSSHYGAISIPDKDRPAVVVLSTSSTPGWDDLAAAVKPLATLLRQPALAYPLKNAFRALQRNNVSLGAANIDINLLATELGIDIQRVSHILNSLRGDLTIIRSFLRPLICYYVDEASMRLFTREAGSAETTAELIPIISSYLGDTGLAAEELLKVCEESDGFIDLREHLSLNFARFNEALIAADEAPDLDPAAHDFALSNFIESYRVQIMDCVRKPFVASFDMLGDLSDYLRLKRGLDLLKPDKGWLISYKSPPDDLLTSFINEWLSTNNAPMLHSSSSTLEPVNDVSRANKNTLDKFITQLAPTVRAWCDKNSVPLPEMWRDTINARSNIVTSLNDVGALDFRRLTTTSIFEWLVKINVWPEDMPHSSVLEDLGLSPKDLNKADEELKRRQEEVERNRRSVDFGGISIDPNNFDPEGVSKRIEEVVKGIRSSVKLGHPINLSPIASQHPKPSRSGGSSYRWRETLPTQKKELIGFIGECVVYHWLKRRFPSKDIDQAWVSSNREKMLLGKGNDSLGYDFEVRYLNKKWHLEVKASVGDPLEFELGETEVRKARDCAGSKSDEYYIIYVSNLSTPSAAKIEQLPNPMSDTNKNNYRLMGEGLKYRFLRS